MTARDLTESYASRISQDYLEDLSTELHREKLETGQSTKDRMAQEPDTGSVGTVFPGSESRRNRFSGTEAGTGTVPFC